MQEIITLPFSVTDSRKRASQRMEEEVEWVEKGGKKKKIGEPGTGIFSKH